jgi:hypothetical protein
MGCQCPMCQSIDNYNLNIVSNGLNDMLGEFGYVSGDSMTRKQDIVQSDDFIHFVILCMKKVLYKSEYKRYDQIG